MNGAIAYQMRSEGMSWGEIAEKINCVFSKNPESAVLAAAKHYATKAGLTWPLKTLHKSVPRSVSGKQRLAYELRSKGKTWKDVACMAGYSHAAHACVAAHMAAEREGLPWPVEKKAPSMRESSDLRVF